MWSNFGIIFFRLAQLVSRRSKSSGDITMEVNFGTLSIRGLNSLLMPQDAWLLLVGFPDPKQAAVAATNFIVNVRHLADQAHVAVTGTKGTVGSQAVIIMSDINAAGALMAHAVATPEYRALTKKDKQGSPRVGPKQKAGVRKRSPKKTPSKDTK
jgi:hypothetical protein